MKIYDIKTETGEPHAFEIKNLFVSRGRACRIAASVPGAQMIRANKSWFSDDVFCVFRVGDREIEIMEPFGDNSRFLIGGRPPGWSNELVQVREVFAKEPAFRFPWSKRARHAV